MLSESEKLHPLCKAIERATGRRVHFATAHRWRTRGVNGIKLESVRMAGSRLTSVEAVRRFIATSTAAADGVEIPTRTESKRNRDIQAAEKELQAAGW